MMKNLFPYDSVRPVQGELIKDVEGAIVSGKKILVNAPTGLGKTASTLPAALAYALENDKVVFFLTNRHTQHQIAIETLSEIKKKHQVEFASVDLVGKQWMCSQDVAFMFSGDFNEFCKSMREGGKCEFYEKMKGKKELSVEAKKLIEDLRFVAWNVEEMKTRCQHEKLCSYFMALEMAKQAQVIVADYYYMFNPSVRDNFLARIGRELEDCILIVDEGHNLPGRVRDLMTSKLSNFMLKNAIKESKRFGFSEAVGYLSRIQDVLVKLNLDDAEEVVVDKERFFDGVNKIKKYDELLAELEPVAEEIRVHQNKSSVGGVIGFLEKWVGGDDGFVRYIVERETRQGPMVSLHYSCLDPSLITQEVFDKVHSAVVMSGTLVPTEMFKDVLGVDGEEKSYPSPFPPSNRLSFVVPQVSTKFKFRSEAMYQKIAEVCVELIKEVPGNCALFFPSYELRDLVYKNFSDCGKKVFLENFDLTKEEKAKLIEDFKSCKDEGAVLLAVAAANFSEGIDLPGDFLKAVFVVGLPLARPDLLTKKLIAYYEEKFNRGWDYGYIFPAINKVLQAAGRCIRSETDKGAIVFLDVRFTWPNYAKCIEGWDIGIEEDYVGRMRGFFNS